MTPADEIARLRRELEYAIDAARENGKERDELARQLGVEVARSMMYLKASDAHFAGMMRACDERDEAEMRAKELRLTIEKIDGSNRRREDAINGADKWSREIRELVCTALAGEGKG